MNYEYEFDSAHKIVYGSSLNAKSSIAVANPNPDPSISDTIVLVGLGAILAYLWLRR